MLQQLLAVGHKYQLLRMQLWCERQLCNCISIDSVCSVLCQAHLYDAKKLEEKCLKFIKENVKEVMKTESYASLTANWPQVSLKITLHIASIAESEAAATVERHENARKRHRTE